MKEYITPEYEVEIFTLAAINTKNFTSNLGGAETDFDGGIDF